MSRRGEKGGSEEEDDAEILEPIEEIIFNESAEEDGFLVREESKILNLYPSRTSNYCTGSRWKFENLVNYGWETDYGNGQLIATHVSGRYIAYVIKVSGAGVGAVRIFDIPANERILMKASHGLVKDVDFVHKIDELIVGFIDEMGTVYIYKILKAGPNAKIEPKLLLQISMDEQVRSDYRRFIWCKFVPDETEPALGARDCALHFALLQNNKVYVANVNQIIEACGEGVHTLSSLSDNYMFIDTHSDAVTDASFAPDGTALATCGRDGTVNFFQVYFANTESPRCLYSWAPHDGKPVSKIFFLDDHNLKQNSDSQYWKFVITANEHMTQVKIWTCKSWTCLQTLNFQTSSPSQFKMDLDIGAKYLIMTDIYRKSVYVIYLEHGEEAARFAWINEFSLPSNMISFNVNCARKMSSREIIQKGYDNYLVNPPSQRPVDAFICFLEIYFIQPKSMQKGNVAFPLPLSFYEPRGSFGSKVNGGGGGVPNLNKLSNEPPAEDRISTSNSQRKAVNDSSALTEAITKLAAKGGEYSRENSYSSSNNKSPTPLMSPSLLPPSLLPQQPLSQASYFATTTTNQNMVLTEQLSSLIGVGSGSLIKSKSHSPDIAPHRESVENKGIDRDFRRTSSSSSPSREVEEIMSPKNNEYGTRSETSQSFEATSGGGGGGLIDDDNNQLRNADGGGQKPSTAKSIHRVLEIKKGVVSGGDLVSQEQLPQMIQQVNSLMEMMSEQNTVLNELKRQVDRLNSEQRAHQQQPPPKPVKAGVDEAYMSRILEKYFSNLHKSIGHQESLLKTTLERQKSTPQIPANLAEVVSVNCARVIKSELEANIMPSIRHVFEPTRNSIQVEVEGLVHVAEARINQEMRKHIQSENFKETFGDVIKSTCDTAVNEHLTNSLIPAFEKALQSIFSQVNNAFISGTKDYLNNLRGVLEMNQKEDKTPELLREHFGNVQDHLSSVLQVEIESSMLRVVNNMTEITGGVTGKLEETLQRELSRAFKDQQKYIELSLLPRSLTPAVSISDHFRDGGREQIDLESLKVQINRLIENGDIPEAFKLVTTHGDSNLLMLICKNLNPNKVLTPQLPIVTRLAIIQQMGSDINGHTDVKLNYLQLAVSTIEPTDRRVVSTISKVLPLYQQSMQRFLHLNPETKLLMSLRLVEMAMKGICMSSRPSYPPSSMNSFGSGGGGAGAGSGHLGQPSIKHEDYSAPF